MTTTAPIQLVSFCLRPSLGQIQVAQIIVIVHPFLAVGIHAIKNPHQEHGEGGFPLLGQTRFFNIKPARVEPPDFPILTSEKGVCAQSRKPSYYTSIGRTAADANSGRVLSMVLCLAARFYTAWVTGLLNHQPIDVSICHFTSTMANLFANGFPANIFQPKLLAGLRDSRNSTSRSR